MKNSKSLPVASDHAVQSKTGKTWAEWFKALDAAGAKRMSHKEIVAHLKSRFLLTRWWQQMITTSYEQARGQQKASRSARGVHARTASRTVSRTRLRKASPAN